MPCRRATAAVSIPGPHAFLCVSRDLLNIVSFGLGIVLLILLTICVVAEALPQAFPAALVRCSESMNNTLWVRRSLAIVVILVLGAANVVDMVGPGLAQPVPSNRTASPRLDPGPD